MPRKTMSGAYRAIMGECASMRPRPDAAENQQLKHDPMDAAHCFNEAAARCRGKPAGGRCQGRGGRHASMRPRPDAAENQTLDKGFLTSYD